MCPRKVKRGRFAVTLTQLKKSNPSLKSAMRCMADLRHTGSTAYNRPFAITVANHELRHDQVYITQFLSRLSTRNTNSTKNNMYIYSLNTLRKSGEWLTSNSGCSCFRYCKGCHQFFHSQWTYSFRLYHTKPSLYICMDELKYLSISFTIYTTNENGVCPL
jgi:hypothetical protein